MILAQSLSITGNNGGGVLDYLYINLNFEPDRMKRMKLKMKKVLFLILLAAMIQIVCYSMRGFIISFSLSLAVSSLGIVPHFKLYMILHKNKVRF